MNFNFFNDWEFRDPWFLLAAVIAPLLWLLLRRSPGVIHYSNLTIPSRAPRSLRVRMAGLPALLLAVAALSIAISLAGPRRGDATTRVSREGIAMMVVLDRSGSMDARDFEQDTEINRLHAVQRVFRDFLTDGEGRARRPDDLIGAIAFGRYPDSVCPLTLDHGSLAAIVGDLEVLHDPQESATAIGDALSLSVERLREHPARSKVVILLTDGEDNASIIDPLTAAQLASDHEVKVYTIGAGRDGNVLFPVFNPRTQQRSFERRFFELDEKQLIEIADLTGGQYFAAEDSPSLERVISEIDELERSEITEVRYLRYTEFFKIFVQIALGCVAAAGIIGGTLLRRLP